MKERPILFSGEMVRAILAGTKTQTRRVVKPQPIPQHHIVWFSSHAAHRVHQAGFEVVTNHGSSVATIDCPFGQPGVRLWVRESVALDYFSATPWLEPTQRHGYRADWTSRAADAIPEPKWRPSIFMPRWASRIALELTHVRVERLQGISEEDATAEGVDIVDGRGLLNPRSAYASLWDSINAKRGFGWETNPWVWALTFKRVEASEAAA